MVAIKRQALLIAIPIALLVAAACGGDKGPGPTTVTTFPRGFPVTIERVDGQELTFAGPPQRIVSLSPAHTEVLFAIGVGDQVIGVDTDSDFPPEVAGRSKFDALDPDLDAIAALEPDLVVVMSYQDELVKALDGEGLKVLWLTPPDAVNTIFDQIDLLGEITGHFEQSDPLVESLDNRVLAVIDKVGAPDGPRIYHEIDSELTTASGETFIGEMYVILWTDNIADRAEQPYPQLSLDEIVQADPEVIIVAHSDASPESVKARPGWQDISAVKNDRIYAIDPDIVNRPGPRVVDGLERLAQILYPEILP